MKTIEERALAYSEQVVNDTPYDVINGKVCVWQEDKDISEVARQAYIDGALEQRKTDIKRAYEWLKARNVLTEASLEGFRKAMEE